MFNIKDGADLDQRLSVIEQQIKSFRCQWDRVRPIDNAITTLQKEELPTTWEFLSSLEKLKMLNQYQAILQLALNLECEHSNSYPMLQTQIIQQHSRLLMDLLIAGGDVNAMDRPAISWAGEEKTTLLGMASNMGNFEAVEILTRYHADLNIKSYYSRDVKGPNIYGPHTAREIAYQNQNRYSEGSDPFNRFADPFNRFEKIIDLLDREANSRLENEFGDKYFNFNVNRSSYYAYLCELKNDINLITEFFCFFDKNSNFYLEEIYLNLPDAKQLLASGEFDRVKQEVIHTYIEQGIKKCAKETDYMNHQPEKWSVQLFKKMIAVKLDIHKCNDEGQNIFHLILQNTPQSPLEARIIMKKMRMLLDRDPYECDSEIKKEDLKGNTPISLVQKSGNPTLIAAFEKELVDRGIQTARSIPVRFTETSIVQQRAQIKFCQFI